MKDTPLKVYKSNFCPHSLALEHFLKKQDIAVEWINIDNDPAARGEVMAINNGYASVPTLVFPDGATLTEPSRDAVRRKLRLEKAEGVLERLRNRLARR